jgi:hypothetical protein
MDSSDDGDGGSSGDGSHGGGSGDVVYVGPLLWPDDDHDALCEPPSTLILPEYPVFPALTVTWGLVTVPLISQGDNDAVVTTSTVVTPKPFPLSYILFYLVYVFLDAGNMTLYPTQAIMPSSLPITLFPLVLNNTHGLFLPGTTGPLSSITAGLGATFTSLTTGVVIVAFNSSSHSVDVQPTPTGTIIQAKPPIPKITVKPGKPHDSEGCGPGSTKPGCEINLCDILGTCPGSSGGSSGGGGSHGHGNDDDDDEPTSCSTTQTASICTEVISSYTPAGAATMTTTTESYCVATAGCSPTGSTETITRPHPATAVPPLTSGSNPGKVEITYYKDDGKKSGEWDVWNISQFPLPEGIYIGCPEVLSVAPDAVITDGAYNGMSFTIFGTKCTYKDTLGGFALVGKKMGELHCDKYRNADCTKGSGGGTCAKGNQNWNPLVICKW